MLARRLLLLSAIPVIALLLSGCRRGGGPVQPGAPKTQPVTVLVAASTQDAMKELAATFQKSTGVRITISAGASNQLSSQIMQGAPADLFLSASSEWADTLAKQGYVQQFWPLLSNDLVLIVPSANPAKISSPADLVKPEVLRVALAGENVPAGKYGAAALESLKLLHPLITSSRIVRGSDVRSALAFVQRCEADAGIVYATDARNLKDVTVIATFDPATHPKIVYPLVLLKRDPVNPDAQKFFDFLTSDSAGEVFEKFGFRMIQ